MTNNLTTQAVACIRGGGLAPALRGTIRFFQKRDGVQVTVQVRGLPDSPTGFFALHIHEGGDCAGEAFGDTGGHYNPDGTKHPCHAGDLPPLLSAGGNACLSVLTDRFRVEDIVGRTVVIHTGPDDFHTQPAGNSGKKMACGLICRV